MYEQEFFQIYYKDSTTFFTIHLFRAFCKQNTALLFIFIVNI